MADHVVTAPLVIAKRADGSDVYLYEGTPLPDGLKEGEAKRLKDAGLVGSPESEDSGDDKKPARKSAASK